MPERCRVAAEARSLDEDRVEALVGEMVERLHDGANAASATSTSTVERLFRGYRQRAAHPAARGGGGGAARLRATSRGGS